MLHFIEKRLGVPWQTLFFLAGIFCFFAIDLFFLFKTHGLSFSSLLFADKNDTFMDFFNVMHDATLDNPYANETIYPPFCYVILRFLSHFIPLEFLGANAFAMRDSQSGQLVFLVFTIILIFCILLFTFRKKKGSTLEKSFFCCAVLLSAPFLFALERGNIIFIALLALMLFIFWYDSKSTRKREAALLALAVAVNIKVYPVLFGLLLLRDKRFRDALRCALYGCLLFILPFFFYGGLGQIPIFFSNVLSESTSSFAASGFGHVVSFSGFLSVIQAQITGVELHLGRIATYTGYLLGLACLGASFVFKVFWKRILALTVAICGALTMSYGYTLTFMLLPLILFLNETHRMSKKNILYLLLLLGIFLWIPTAAPDFFGFIPHPALPGWRPLQLTTIVEQTCLFSLALLLIVDAAVKLLQMKTAQLDGEQCLGVKRRGDSLTNEESNEHTIRDEEKDDRGRRIAVAPPLMTGKPSDRRRGETTDAGKNSPAKPQRNSSLELLRIVCMLLIITHHTVVHGGAAADATGLNLIISLFFLPIGKIAFVCFVILSSYFLVDKIFSAERLLRVWLEVLFYSLFFVGITWAFNPSAISGVSVFSAFFPIVGNSHGFAAAYLAFYLLTPFLSLITRSITKRQAGILLLLLFWFEIGSQVIGSITEYYQHLYSELLLFIFLYYVVFYLKRWPIRLLGNKVFPGMILAAIWLGLFLSISSMRFGYGNPVFEFILSFSGDESSILSIIGGIALFFLFKNINMPTLPLVNRIAKTTFGILLIHDHNFFRPVLWKQIVNTQAWYASTLFPVYLIVTAIFVFIGGMIIDFLRMNLLEKPLFNSKRLRQWCQRCDAIINKRGTTPGT
jgi:hypothetical protein